jgi:hypothetical protein
MAEIRLPAYVFEPNLAAYVERLLKGTESGSVTLNFEAIRFYIPGAIVATLAQIRNWHKNDQKVIFRKHQSNPVCGGRDYLAETLVSFSREAPPSSGALDESVGASPSTRALIADPIRAAYRNHALC